MRKELKAKFEREWEASCKIEDKDFCSMCCRDKLACFIFTDECDPAYGFSCCEDCLVEILKRLRATKKRGAH